jgi:hypothetical protein
MKTLDQFDITGRACLVTGASSYMTGSHVLIDGGMALGKFT